jgi:hypothetical protein
MSRAHGALELELSPVVFVAVVVDAAAAVAGDL